MNVTRYSDFVVSRKFIARCKGITRRVSWARRLISPSTNVERNYRDRIERRSVNMMCAIHGYRSASFYVNSGSIVHIRTYSSHLSHFRFTLKVRKVQIRYYWIHRCIIHNDMTLFSEITCRATSRAKCHDFIVVKCGRSNERAHFCNSRYV